MSINPPPQIADFFGFLTGMPWPEADEDLMRTVANDYYAVAEDLTILEGYIGQLVPIVLEHFEGDAAESYAAAMRDLIGEVSGPNTMHQTSQLSHDLGDAARNVANQVEYTKLMAIIQVVELLVQVLTAMLFSPFTFGGSFFNVALEFAFTREALKNLFVWLLRTIASQTFMGIAGGIFQDLVIQVYQLSSHHTDKWNTDSTVQSIQQGALNGLFAGPLELFAQGAGRFLGKLFGKGAGSILSEKIESSIKAGMNGLENSAEHFAGNAGKSVGHAALEGLSGFVGSEAKGLGKKTVGELAETAAESGVRGAAKTAAEGARQAAQHNAAKLAGEAAESGLRGAAEGVGHAAERDVAKLAGKLGDEASQQAFAKEVGNLLGAAVPQIEAGFVRFGTGTIAEAFADKMGAIFEKHLADTADSVLRGEANKIGHDFGEAFARNWGRLAADHGELSETLSRALGDYAGHQGLSALAHGLPDLFTPAEITGNAVSKLFQRMFEEHPLHGNALYQLGHSVGEMLKDGLENNLNEGAFNLIFMEDHQFTTSWNTFVSGAAMGLIGKTLHKLFEPAMTRYQEWLRDRQYRDNPDDSKYFGLLHPLNFVSFIANMSGHSAPFPVPRPTSHDIDASAGESAKDLLKWFFGNPLSGFDFRSDTPVVNWFTSSDNPAADGQPAQDAPAETPAGVKTSGGTDAGVTGDSAAPDRDKDSSTGDPATTDTPTASARPRTESAGVPDGTVAPDGPRPVTAGTDGDTTAGFDTGLPRITQSRPFHEEFGRHPEFGLTASSPRPAPVDGPRAEAAVSDAFDAVLAGREESPLTELITRLTAEAPDQLTLTSGRTLGHDAEARELAPVVDRMHDLGLLDDQRYAAISTQLRRPANSARFTLEWVHPVPAEAATEVARLFGRALDVPLTPQAAARMGLALRGSVGPDGENRPEDLAAVRQFLADHGRPLPAGSPLDPAVHLVATYLKDGPTDPTGPTDPAGAARLRDDTTPTVADGPPETVATGTTGHHAAEETVPEQPAPENAEATAAAPSTRGDESPIRPAPVSFAEGTKTPDRDARAQIRDLAAAIAPEVARRHHQGLDLPVVKVTGRGNGLFSAGATGKARAKAVADVLEQGLRRELADLGIDVPSLIRVESAGKADAPADLFQGWDLAARRRTAIVSLDYSSVTDRPATESPAADHVLVEIPAGGWIGEDALPASSARKFREALEHLPPRADAYVLAMHVGENGAPITARQLSDVLIDAYDSGRLDGKSTIDFVACGLGSLVHGHVPEAMAALWAHHALNGRPEVPAVIEGRAPAGPVWAVPKVVDGSVRPDAERELVVADYVGVRPDGRQQVVVLGPDSFWRTFSDSGDGAHTPETRIGGGHLASDGSTDHELPTGYRRHDAVKVNDPSAGLDPLGEAVRFGGADAPSPFTSGAGRQGRDLYYLRGSGILLESRPLGPDPGADPAGRAYLSEAEFTRHEPAGSTDSVLTGFRGDLPDYRHLMVDPADPRHIVEDLGRVPAPWAGGEKPYVVMAELSDRGIRLTTDEGRQVKLRPRAFAAMVAADPLLMAKHPDAPIVLAISSVGGADLEIARAVAAATDRVVYAPTGAVTLVPEPGGWALGLKAPHTLADGSRGPRGQIIRIDPPSRGGLDPALGNPGHVVTRRGAVVADHAVLTRPIVGSGSLTAIGRAMVGDPDWYEREGPYSALADAHHYVTWPDEPSTLIRRVPWDPGHAYFFAVHSNDESFELVTSGGSEPVSGAELGAHLARRPSVVALKKAADEGKPASIVLLACESAAQAQQVADSTGLPVHAPTTTTGVPSVDRDPYDLSEAPHPYVVAGPDGAYGEFLTFHPGGLLPVEHRADGAGMRPLSIAFKPKSKALVGDWPEEVQNMARAIAPELVRRHHAGLEMPVVKVTGRGNGAFSAASTGRARAIAVADLLTTTLRDELSARGVDIDVASLIRTASAARSEPGDDVFPEFDLSVRRRTATVELEFPRPAATDASSVTVREIPAGGWIGDLVIPRSSVQEFRDALRNLPGRDDTFVLAMHVGENGAPVTERQLADVLIDAYDNGMLDGKSTIDFVSCRFGDAGQTHVSSAMAELWAHQVRNPRPGVPGAVAGRAPVGDVWVVPKADGEREVIVADHVGIRPDGRPVVVVGGNSVWRTFTDSGDGLHTARTSDSGTDHDVPEGYERDDAADPAGLSRLKGAVKFGTEDNGGPSRPNRVPPGTGAGPASRNRPSGGGGDHSSRIPRRSGSDPATEPDRRDRRPSPAGPRERLSERSSGRDRLSVPSSDRSRSASPAPQPREAGTGRASAAQPGRAGERSRERSPFGGPQQAPPGSRGSRPETAHSRSAGTSGGDSSPRRTPQPAPLSADARITLQDAAARWLFKQPGRTALTSRQVDRITVYTDTAERLGLLLTGPLAEGSLQAVQRLFRGAAGPDGRITVSTMALDGLVRNVLGVDDRARVSRPMLHEVFEYSEMLNDIRLPVTPDNLRGMRALSDLVGSGNRRRDLDDLAQALVGGERGPRTTADLVEVAGVVQQGGRVTLAALRAGLNGEVGHRHGRPGSEGARSGGGRDRVRPQDRPAPEAVQTESSAVPGPAGPVDVRRMITDHLRGRASKIRGWSEQNLLRYTAHKVFDVPADETLPTDAHPRLERLALTAHESGIPFSLEDLRALRRLLDAASGKEGTVEPTLERFDRVVRDVMSLPSGTAVDSGHRSRAVALARYLEEGMKSPVTLADVRTLRALTGLSPSADDPDVGYILRGLARRVLPGQADGPVGPEAVSRLLELASTADRRHPLDIDTLRAAARGGLDEARRDTGPRPAPDAMEVDTPDGWRSPASPDDSSAASTPTASGSALPGTPESRRSSSDESLASEVQAFDEMAITAPVLPTLAAPAPALPAPPAGFHGNEAFWQAIGADRRIGERLTEDQYLRFVQESGEGGGRPLGFVVNTMVNHKDVGRIHEVLAAITQGMEGMDGRVAVVVGVNAESGNETQLREAVSTTRRAVADLGLPVAVVPATFKPKGDKFPYGKMRNAVMHDEATRQLIGAMVKNGLHPYLSIQDFDQGSRMTTGGGHIFNRVEEQLKVRHGEMPPVRPLAYIGGYRMPDRADLQKLLDDTIDRYPADEVPPQLLDRELSKRHLDQLQEAVRKDMTARRNQARIHPLLPYAPEPNLFVDGAAVLLRDDRGGPRISWGEGAAEFARLGQDLNQLNGWELRQHHEPQLDRRPRSVPVPGSRLPTRENRPMPRGRDEIHAQVAADAANNRLPHRGEAFRTDFVDGATPTDLSRLSQTLLDKNGVLAQTHANLTTVLDRLFQGKSAKDGVELADVRKVYSPRSRDVYENQQPLRPRRGGETPEQPLDVPMASQLGDKPANVLNSAVSAPVGGPFKAKAGVQDEHKLHAALELALSTEDLVLGRKLAYVRFEPDILGHRELSRLDVFPTRPRSSEEGVGRRDRPARSESGVPADGDCLYHAVNAVRRIEVGSDTALQLRNTVLDWMLVPGNLSHVVRFANDQGVDINDLVTTIAVSGNWHGPAGDLAATMVASALNARLVIEAGGVEHTVVPLHVPGPRRSRPGPPVQEIRLRLSENHYEPVSRTVLGEDGAGGGRAAKRRRDPEDGPGRGTKRSNTSDARQSGTSSAGPSRPRSGGRQDGPSDGGTPARQRRDEDTEMTDTTPTKGVRKFGGADGTPAPEERVTQTGGDPISEMVEALSTAHVSGTRLLQSEGSDPGRAAAVARFPQDERFFSIAIHTGSGGTPVWGGREVTPAEFAVVLAELHERGVWDGGTPLQFSACRLGDEHEYSFAAETMLLLHEQLPHLPLEAYAPDGDLWHVPSVLPTGGLDHEGPGHLVVGGGVVVDSSGRPRIVPGGGWLRMTVAPHGGELLVDELGAHLVVDVAQRPNAQPAPPGYALFEGGSHDPLDQAVSFGPGAASPRDPHERAGVPRPPDRAETSEASPVPGESAEGAPAGDDPARAADGPNGLRLDRTFDWSALEEPDGPSPDTGRDVAHWVGDPHPDASAQALTKEALTRFPDADRYFTVAMHTGAEHRPVRDGEVMSAEAVAEHLAGLHDAGAWDGERPLRLVACDLAADPSFVADVMRALWDRGVRADAFAADGPVWFTPRGDGGSELVASRAVGFKATADGVKPALLPGSEWVRFSPPTQSGGQAVTERVGPLLRPRTESPFVDAGPDEHLTPAPGAVAFGTDPAGTRDRHDLPAGQGPASGHAPPLTRTGTRAVPSRSDARPSVIIDDYRVVTPHGDGPQGGSLAERSHAAAFSRRDAYQNGGRVVQTGSGHDAASFPVHRAVRALITEDHPQVRLSHDASLALAQVAGGPKEFYALPEVVERGNVRLRQNGSEARLVLNDEVSIEFEQDGRAVRLFKVSAEFSSAPSGICRDFSHDVLGGTHTHAVLHDARPLQEGGTGSTAIAFVNTASDAEVSGTHHLVAGLMDAVRRGEETEEGPQWAKTLTEKARSQPERDWPTPGEEYGSALNRSDPAGAGLRQELTRKVRSTGVNEEAWAQPGEAYLMQAVSHKASGWERLFTHDFSRTVAGASAERPTTWGYHFASVVVESLDGMHQITLENARFNRRSRELLDETLTATIEHYGSRIDQVRSELEQQVEQGELSSRDPRLELAKLIIQIRETEHELAGPPTGSEQSGEARHEEPSHRTALLESALKQARAEAHRALLTISGEDMGRDGDMWWFTMHGRAEGEGFFDTRAMLDDTTARGTMTNPLVLVLASGLDNQRVDLELDPATQQLSVNDVARLESLAGRIVKGALWRARQGMSLPEIRITSHALPGERSQGVAQRDQVSRRLEEILDARLEAVQRDDPSISYPVRARDLRVVEDLQIRDPERIRSLMGGSDDTGDADLPVHSQVRVEVHLDEHPADRVDHTPEQLADLARQTGLHRGPSVLAPLRGRQAPPDDAVLARMRDIIRVSRRLDGQEGEPGLDVLTGVRRLSDVLAREYGHTGELRTGHLDPLVRDVLGLGFSAEVTTADRVHLLDVARAAKVSGRPITVKSLTRTYARLGPVSDTPDTRLPAEDVQAGPSRAATGPAGPSRPTEGDGRGPDGPAAGGSEGPAPRGDQAAADAVEPVRPVSPVPSGPDTPLSELLGPGSSLRLPVLDWWTSAELAGLSSESAAVDHPVQAPDAGEIRNGEVRSARPEYGAVSPEVLAGVGVLEISPQHAEQVLGIPLRNQERFQRMADDERVVIEVRPTNPDSVPHLERGAMPKPVDIKAKTISDDDIWLGAKAEHKGLVGFFEPEQPRRTAEIDAEPGRFDRVMARFRQRTAEHAELQAKMAKLEADQRFRVVDGVVEGRDESGTWRQIAGDHDIFDLHDPGGLRADQDTYEASVSAMVRGDMGVMHGAHMFWEPQTPFDKMIFDKIVKSHQPGGESLVRFVPGMKRPILSTTEPELLSSDGRTDLGPFAGDPRRHAHAVGAEPLMGWVDVVTEGEQPAGPGDGHEPSSRPAPEPPSDPEPLNEREPEASHEPLSEPEPEPEVEPEPLTRPEAEPAAARVPVVPTEAEPAAEEPSAPHPRSVADTIAEVLAPSVPGPRPPAPRGSGDRRSPRDG